MSRILTTALVFLVLASLTKAEKATADKYPFAVPPLEIFDRLAKAELNATPALSADDRAFLKAMWAARSKPAADRKPPTHEDILRAVLLASGVSAPADRAKYSKQFEAVVADAEKAVAGAATPRAKADKLLRFLHAGPMKGGYDADQTSLPGVFNSGKFNCVSSGALFHLVGTRLGLELKVVLIPGGIVTAGHATIDLVDGRDRVQIEPTNPDGFDWATKRNRPGVLVLGIEPDRKDGYDADALGLAGSTASNLGVAAAHAKSPRHAEAVRWNAVALALHPANRTAATNLAAALSGWGKELVEGGKVEAALRLFAVASAVAPDDYGLRTNHAFVWAKAIDAELDAERLKAGLDLVARAATAIPADRDFQHPAEWLARAAERKRKANGWEAGLVAAERGLKALPAAEATDLRSWRSGAYRRWSQELLGKADYDGSLKVLAAGLAATPKDSDLHDGLEYHTQHALAELHEKAGADAAAAHFKSIAKAFPTDVGVKDTGVGHVRRRVADLSEANKFAEAVQAAAAGEPFAGGSTPEVVAEAYNRWARHLAGRKEWEAALAKYAEGRKAVPTSDRLVNNTVATVLEWAEPAVDKENWAEAVKILDVGLRYFPGNERLVRAQKTYQDRTRK